MVGGISYTPPVRERSASAFGLDVFYDGRENRAAGGPGGSGSGGRGKGRGCGKKAWTRRGETVFPFLIPPRSYAAISGRAGVKGQPRNVVVLVSIFFITCARACFYGETIDNRYHNSSREGAREG